MATQTLFFSVRLARKEIDGVNQQFHARVTRRDAETEVYRSLVNHDGYDPGIRVVLITPLTHPAWDIEGDYGSGWECENRETSLMDARRSLNEYRENGPGQYRLVRRQVSIWED